MDIENIPLLSTKKILELKLLPAGAIKTIADEFEVSKTYVSYVLRGIAKAKRITTLDKQKKIRTKAKELAYEFQKAKASAALN